MKKLWKALGITALAAAAASALVPYRIRKDEEEDVTTVDALLWQLTRRPGESEEEKNQVDITIGFKSPLQDKRDEQELFTEDPDEAVLFADDDPGAAVVEAVVEQAEAAAEDAEARAEELEAKVEEFEAKAEEAEAAADEAEAVEEAEAVAEAVEEAVEPEATEEDFDPDL